MNKRIKIKQHQSDILFFSKLLNVPGIDPTKIQASIERMNNELKALLT
jgi:hypothetical protein